MKSLRLRTEAWAGFCLGLSLVLGRGTETVDFEEDIRVILESACLSCHNLRNIKGELRMETRDLTLKGGANGKVLMPGSPEDSPLYTSTILPANDENVMPPKPPFLTQQQIDLLRRWIEQGAAWPATAVLRPVERMLFGEHIQPILEISCVSCHWEGQVKGGLRLDTKQAAFKGGENGAVILPGNPARSPLYTCTVLSPNDDNLMPPRDQGGPLSKEKTDVLRNWILQGAYWPEEIILQPRAEATAKSVDELELVKAIHKQIVANRTVTCLEEMESYTNTIPGSAAVYSMVPIPGGQFRMGSPATEPGRSPDEGPVHLVDIGPFWMGQYEVTWNEFELFMYPALKQPGGTQQENREGTADAVARPSAPYVDLSFGMGKERHPAISMTQHAANKYCQWLSAKTGHFYRLPTEAEWEYACRAGTTTAYHFGDDPARIDEYAWHADNSNWKYQKIGTKKPNPWGLYDMHGNVAEWCLDQYQSDYYAKCVSAVSANPWNKATLPYPHVVRGGSWDDDPAKLRSAARRASDPVWKMQDPQLPKSVWYHTDAQFLGFRIVRPLDVPPAEALFHYWNSGVEQE